MEQTENAPSTNLWSGRIWPTLRPYVIDFLRFCARVIKKGVQELWSEYLEPLPTRYIFMAVVVVALLFEFKVGLIWASATVNYEVSRKNAALSVAELLQQGKRERAVKALRVGDLLVQDGKPCYITQIATDPTPRAFCQTALAAQQLTFSGGDVLDPRVTIVPSTDDSWRSYMLQILELSKPAPPPPAAPVVASPKTAPLVRF